MVLSLIHPSILLLIIAFSGTGSEHLTLIDSHTPSTPTNQQLQQQQQQQQQVKIGKQLPPGSHGVGQVFSVTADELDQLHHQFSSSLNNSNSDSTTTTTSSTTTPFTEPPPKIVANPEDSSRTKNGYVEIDRKKAEAPPQHQQTSPQDLSFTGILNGLLDSFINDPPTSPSSSSSSSSPTYHRPSSSTSSNTPSNEDDELEEDDELDEDDLLELHSSSSSSPSPQEEDDEDPMITSSSEDVLTQATSEEPMEDDETDGEDEPISSNSKNTTKSSRPCGGECRNIIFGLFLCDEIDNDAFCSEPGLACCVNNEQEYRPYGNNNNSNKTFDDENEQVSTQELLGDEDDDEEEEDALAAAAANISNNSDEDDKATTSTLGSSSSSQRFPPSSQQQSQAAAPPPPPPPPPKYNSRPPPPPPHHHYSHPHPPPHYYYHNQNSQPPPPQTMLMHHPPRIPLPCPRYCVKNFLDPYCSERLPSQFACGVDGFCCGHDVPVNSIKDDEDAGDAGNNNGYRNDGVDEEEQAADDIQEDADKKVIGPCTEEIGSCVSRNIISIICFAHASPTDMYTCPRSSMKCCARKTALPKDTQSTPAPLVPKPGDTNSITRNSSSVVGKPPQLPPAPQILPQFAPQQPPHLPPPPPHHPAYQQQYPPTPPPLAETPPPPIHSIPSTQFTSPFTSNSLGSTRVPPRQPVGSYVCGVKGVPTVAKRRRRKRVVGGSDSLPGEWCWQVALINSLNQYLCGGALIGTQWVLTAAHCVTNIVRSGDAIYVRVGDHDLTSRYGSPGAQTLRVATTYIHHNHNSQTLDNDIALLKLQGNAALKEGVCLVCLPSRNHMSEIPGKRCTVTGYGYMGESGPIPLRIREANLPIVSEDECVRKVNAVTEKVFALPMSSFCAGGELRNDACQGDGGGPLVCRADDPTTGDPGTGYYELTGLVSWGFGCGRENVPGVYVKVSSFIGWIHQIIRSN